MSSEGDEGEPPNQTGHLLDEWELLNSHPHALGHRPSIGRRIALTVYGVHPDAWSRRARPFNSL